MTTREQDALADELAYRARRRMAMDINVAAKPTEAPPGDADIKRDDDGKFSAEGHAKSAAEHKGKAEEHRKKGGSNQFGLGIHHHDAAERHEAAVAAHEKAGKIHGATGYSDAAKIAWSQKAQSTSEHAGKGSEIANAKEKDEKTKQGYPDIVAYLSHRKVL